MNNRIDPTNITNYNRTEEELQLFLIFCICVAGKTAKQISTALETFLTTERFYKNYYKSPKEFGGEEIICESLNLNSSPFAKIYWLAARDKLTDAIKDSKLGQFKKLTFAFTELIRKGFDLRKVTAEELESIKGIGPKTSRFFILHSRKTNNIACLDTHQLKFMRDNLGISIPKAPPRGKKYLELEKQWLEYAKKQNKTTAELDLAIWNASSKRSGNGSQIDNE